MKKKHLKSLQKKRKLDDLESFPDDDHRISQMLPTPKDFNASERGKTPGDSKKQKNKKKAKTTSDDNGISMQNIAKTLPTPDFSGLPPFVRCHWKGDKGEDPPGDALKTLRKSIGVLVRGNLQLCPPPIVDINSSSLPVAFSKVFLQLGLTKPSPIQMQCWPAALSGANVLAIAPTGSGKTLAYTLPLIPHIESRQLEPTSTTEKGPAPFALVLVPTRELAIQVNASMKPLRRCMSTAQQHPEQSLLRCVAVYGGQDKDSQVGELRSGELHVVVATPGRLIDLICSKKISLSRVSYLVLDEADRMLAMGFFDQLSTISRLIRDDRQTLLFTATFPGNLREAADKWAADAVTIRCNTMEMHRDSHAGQAASGSGGPDGDAALPHETNDDDENDAGDDSTGAAAKTAAVSSSSSGGGGMSLTISPTVTQEVHVCAAHKKPRLLIRYISTMRETEKADKVRQPGAMMIFATKIKSVKFVVDFLRRQNTIVEMLHGQMPQNMREKTLADFKAGKTHTLVCTDVASRGIHIKRLRYVVNYDFPGTLEVYCHRVGRTGRQGEVGVSYSLVTRNMAPLAGDLISLLKSTNQRVEPNLESLADEFNSGAFVFDCEDEEGDAAGQQHDDEK